MKQNFLTLNTMKKITLFCLAGLSTALISSCGLNSGNGELIGVQGRNQFKPFIPYGMVYIPSGSFHMGQNDQDVGYAQVNHNRQITISAFYMDETEITNNEYRQFSQYVMDSIVHKLIGGEHIVTDADGKEFINWKERIRWDDPAVQEATAELYFPEEERIFGKKEIDVKKLIYHAEWYDLTSAANKANRDKPRSTFIMKDDVPVYPDTLCFISDFAYSMNDPIAEKYFWHPAYDEYPVVGVSWRQARAFTVWRSRMLEQEKIARGEAPPNNFRLPTEAEWEYASRAGRVGADYPWGGPYIRNSKGCLLANFKPGRGNYIDDGGYYTVKVTAYFPNDYGLYNMAGNVSEWTSTAYDESGYIFSHDLNPNISYEAKADDPEVLKRKTVRGGSWKDIGYFLQNGSRQYEFQDTAKSYVGFRCVMSYMGRSIADE
jgi:formylglycine-generating enzyme